MELNAFNRLKNFTVKIEDEEVGRAADFIIDTNHWSLRSLHFTQGIWPFTRHMEIPVEHIETIDHQNETIELDVTKAILEDPTQNPIKNLGSWFSNLFRWGSFRYRQYYGTVATKASADVRATQALDKPAPNPDKLQDQEAVSSLDWLDDFTIRTGDGERIQIKDFVLDFEESSPRIQFIVVGSDKRKTMPAEWIKTVNRETKTLGVLKSREMVMEGA